MHSSERGFGHDLIKNGVGIDCLPEDVIMKVLGEVDSIEFNDSRRTQQSRKASCYDILSSSEVCSLQASGLSN